MPRCPAFVACCPRSGSTWMRFLLNAHPEVSCGPEYSLFSATNGIGGLIRNYRDAGGHVGFRNALSEDEFKSRLREFCSDLYWASAAEHKAGASIVVDKSSDNALCVPQIRYVFPEARFIFLVRNPIDAASSLSASAKTWEPSFPEAVDDAIRYWCRYNECMLDSIHLGLQPHVVHYERMLEATEAEVSKCYAFLGASPLPRSELSVIVELHRFDKLQTLGWHDGAFFRQGRSSIRFADELSRLRKRLPDEAWRLYEKIRSLPTRWPKHDDPQGKD